MQIEWVILMINHTQFRNHLHLIHQSTVKKKKKKKRKNISNAILITHFYAPW